MNTIMNKTWSYKWMLVVVFSLGLIFALTSATEAKNIVYTPMDEDLDANDWDVHSIDDLDVDGQMAVGSLGGFGAGIIMSAAEEDTSTGTSVYGLNFAYQLNPSGTRTAVAYGARSSINSKTGNAQNITGKCVGNYANVVVAGSGTMSDARGFESDIFTLVGDIDAAYNYYAKTPTANLQTIGTGYGFYHQGWGANVTNKWAFYAASDPSYFGGVCTLADSSQMATSAAPTADADIANKKYVDDQIADKVGDVNEATMSMWIPWMSANSQAAFGCSAAIGDYGSSFALGTTDTAYCTFRVPHDYTSITTAVIVLITDFTDAAAAFDIQSDFAAAGEDKDTHGIADNASTYNVTNDRIFELDISGILDDAGSNIIAANDYVGIKLTNSEPPEDEHRVSLLGIYFRYQ